MLNFLKSLADETRIEILFILNMGEFSVREITEILNMGQSRISRHLKILVTSGIATFRREGAWVLYSLNKLSDERREIIESIIRWKSKINDSEELLVSIKWTMEKRRRLSRDYFSRIGSRWNKLKDRYIDTERLYSELNAKLIPEGVIADLGCGIGESIARMTTQSRKFIGVDNSREMLGIAKKNLSAALKQGTDLRVGDLEHLPLKEKEVDGILAALVLHHVAQPIQAFREFYRVLKPGGQVLIVDFKKHQNKDFQKKMADLWSGFNRNELLNWISESGFRDPEFTESSTLDKSIKLLIITAWK